jgi:hypothetical protein
MFNFSFLFIAAIVLILNADRFSICRRSFLFCKPVGVQYVGDDFYFEKRSFFNIYYYPIIVLVSSNQNSIIGGGASFGIAMDESEVGKEGKR